VFLVLSLTGPVDCQFHYKMPCQKCRVGECEKVARHQCCVRLNAQPRSLTLILLEKNLENAV